MRPVCCRTNYILYILRKDIILWFLETSCCHLGYEICKLLFLTIWYKLKNNKFEKIINFKYVSVVLNFNDIFNMIYAYYIKVIIEIILTYVHRFSNHFWLCGYLGINRHVSLLITLVYYIEHPVLSIYLVIQVQHLYKFY